MHCEHQCAVAAVWKRNKKALKSRVQCPDCSVWLLWEHAGPRQGSELLECFTPSFDLILLLSMISLLGGRQG